MCGCAWGQIQFSSTFFSFSIQETASIGVQVGVLTFTSGIPASFQITDCTQAYNSFYIDPVDSSIHNNIALDAEIFQTVSFTVIVTDVDSSTDQTLVIISIIDVDETPPAFPTNTMNVTVPETIATGGLIASLSARDVEFALRFRHLSFAIVGGDPTHMFMLTPQVTYDTYTFFTNVLLQGALDFAVQRLYTLTIMVTNGHLNSNMTLQVNVTQVNRRSPVFTPSLYTVTFNESAPVGSVIARVVARDGDTGAFGNVSYSLIDAFTNAPSTVFTIATVSVNSSYNANDGVIRLATALDDEAAGMLLRYSLMVTAADQGSPPLTSTAFVSVIVTDVNRFTPYFLQVCLIPPSLYFLVV